MATNLFPLYVLLGSFGAALHPPLFSFFRPGYITPTLSLIMLSMGLSMQLGDFTAILSRHPRQVLFGAAAQYTIMPLVGYTIARTFGLARGHAVGLLLVACCPGGTASNLVSYLARANVALSVLMTACTTLAAVLMTPLLMKVLAGAIVPVDAWGLFTSMVQVVLAPVALGLALRLTPFGRTCVRRLEPVLPLLSVIGVVLINGSIVARSALSLRTSALPLFAALLTLHGTGLVLGFAVARLCRYDERMARTVAIEVCMQNSGLGAALAQTHFAAQPSVAVPAAISASMHSIMGSLAAGYWRWSDARKAANKGEEAR